MKKLLSMLLAAAMLVSASAMAFAEGTSEKGTIVYGSSTEIGGDFAPDSWWTNNATDKMICNLTNDYTVTTTNQGGEYVVNPTIANNIEMMAVEGSDIQIPADTRLAMVATLQQSVEVGDHILHICQVDKFLGDEDKKGLYAWNGFGKVAPAAEG